jgi:hypothetical protein
MPYLQQALAERATVDLKPFASSAREKIAGVIADIRKSEGGIRVAAEVTGVKLADIAFDSKMVRIIAEATGAMNVEVKTLPAL